MSGHSGGGPIGRGHRERDQHRREEGGLLTAQPTCQQNRRTVKQKSQVCHFIYSLRIFLYILYAIPNPCLRFSAFLTVKKCLDIFLSKTLLKDLVRKSFLSKT
jgi:hypothetical protein